MRSPDAAITPADAHRAKPGYVYGVGMACSGKREEVEPPCSCPCHVADAPYPSNWYCDKCHSGQMRWTSDETKERGPYSHEQAIADGTANPQPYTVNVADYYFITKGNTLEDAFPRRHFKTAEAAEKAAEQLNEADAIASLNVPASHQARFDRYRKLDRHFGWWWYDGENHPLTRLPSKPGRYAVLTYGDDGDSCWSEHESLDEVKAEIEDGDVERVVDLDSGDDVPFVRTVAVEIAS